LCRHVIEEWVKLNCDLAVPDNPEGCDEFCAKFEEAILRLDQRIDEP